MENDAIKHIYPICGPDVAKLVYIIGKINKSKRILEVGTCIGYFAIFIASSLDCHITTIEKSQKLSEIALENIKNAKLEEKITVINKDANEILLNNSKESLFGNFDMIFIDGAKSQYLRYFNNFQSSLSSNGIIISDNIFFRGLIKTNEEIPKRYKSIVKNLRNYWKFLKNHKSFETTFFSFQDGIAVSIKI